MLSKGLAMPTRSDEMLERIIRAVHRADCRAQKVPCSRGGSHARNVCVRRLRVNGQMHALHVLTHVHAHRRNRYAQVTLERQTLTKVKSHLLYLIHSHRTKLIVVPSKDLLRAFFMGTKRKRYIGYINLDGTPGRAFDFWQYEDAW
jgi:hypothetical protein